MSVYDKVTHSKLYALGDKLGDLIILSLLWLVFSLPVITIGASTAALYHAAYRRFYRDSQTPRQDFMRSLKQNLRQGILITLIYLVYGAFLAFDIYAARNGIGNVKLPAFYEQVAYALILPVVFTLPFIFAYLSRFSNTIRNTFKHSFFFCSSHPIHAVGMLLLAIVSGALMIVFLPAVLLVPVTSAYLCSKWIEKDFNEVIRATGIENASDSSSEGEPDPNEDAEVTP
ncbi:MAG: YesL family protein [Oscillospiraceae bacterium]|nr:YesL family protein [Oscillospiraceae bacterium]